ncbi:MAG: hypothetical protein IFK94_01585 [Acidobacteria bacterium]|uniref:DUF2029 domain-containing protein n=1 Tax=Candidatus Polarisedimenticola svalbardensis TaxID=2886004 RepID=A0A8J6XYM0_9BACT|nr:hypothetical protein [Candidatus Polarisedimenticola svalbardensis]
MSDRNNSKSLIILAGISTGLYLLVATAGDLRNRQLFYLAVFAALSVCMLAGYRLLSRSSRKWTWVVLAAALLFRIVAAAGGPAMSDDIYRYVWDGRVQAAGHHPYSYPPDGEELESLRDEDWGRINHPTIGTIYPPLSQMLFRALATAGAGVRGFRIALGLLDFGVVLALLFLLKRTGRPPDRVLLYAWNPLAVMESSGSGHVEPLGIVLLVLSVAWLASDRQAPMRSAAALAGSIHAKLFSAALLPGHLRRMNLPAVLVLAAVLLALALPFAISGPVTGEGLYRYAEQWERNGLIYPAIRLCGEALDTGNRLKPLVDSLGVERLYRWIWPRELAKVAVLLLAGMWILWLAFRARLDPVSEAMWVLGGLTLLLPTVHPWYLLWVLPFAAACCSPGWILLGGMISLSYWGAGGDVIWPVRILEYGVPLVLIVPEAFKRLGRSASMEP